jgi:hypothetical protein
MLAVKAVLSAWIPPLPFLDASRLIFDAVEQDDIVSRDPC